MKNICLPFIVLNIGEAKVQQKFEIKEGKKKVLVAGCRCVEGVLLKSALYNVIRNNEIIYKGKYITQACVC